MSRTSVEFDAVRNMVSNMSDAEVKSRSHTWDRQFEGALGDYELECVNERLNDIEHREYLNQLEDDPRSPTDYKSVSFPVGPNVR